MHWLITGGAGVIGSHLGERVLGEGGQGAGLGGLATGGGGELGGGGGGGGGWGGWGGGGGEGGGQAFGCVRGSVEEQATVNLLVSQCDGIFHLASAVGVQLIVDEPVRTIRTTIHGTEVVLDAAHRFGRPTLITSSSEVYGKGTRVPFSEEDDVVMGPTRHNRWCYAYSKAID